MNDLLDRRMAERLRHMQVLERVAIDVRRQLATERAPAQPSEAVMRAAMPLRESWPPQRVP